MPRMYFQPTIRKSRRDSIMEQLEIVKADNSYLEKRCQEKFYQLNLNTVEDMKDYIKSLFEKHEDQGDVLIDLYRLVLPDWDRIDKITYSPKIGKKVLEMDLSAVH